MCVLIFFVFRWVYAAPCGRVSTDRPCTGQVLSNEYLVGWVNHLPLTNILTMYFYQSESKCHVVYIETLTVTLLSNLKHTHRPVLSHHWPKPTKICSKAQKDKTELCECVNLQIMQEETIKYQCTNNSIDTMP